MKNKILIGWWVGIDKNCQTKQADDPAEKRGKW